MRGGDRKNLNTKRRKEALREELKSREYLRQLQNMLSEDWGDKVPEMNGKANILLRLLAKTLPDLKSVEMKSTTTIIDTREDLLAKAEALGIELDESPVH